MRAVAPRIGGLTEVTLAEEQPDLMPITAAVVDYADGSRAWLTRWRLTSEEWEKIGRGSDIYLMVLGERMAPIAPFVGVPPELLTEAE